MLSIFLPFFTFYAVRPSTMCVRGFALHLKGALPTNMGFHHSIFTVRILTMPFWTHPQLGRLRSWPMHCTDHSLRA